LTRYPGTISTTGTGTNITIANLPTGTYNFIVTNAAGCISSPSTDIIIPAQPPTPEVPIVGTITQPTLFIQTGSVTLSRLPSSGTWIITRLPDLVKVTGTGTSFTVTGIKDGKYKFTVTNSSGCTSGPSAEVIISTPVSPVLVINDPEPVCTPATVDITSPAITEGSPPGLTFTYWTDDNATLPYNTPATASAGTYYIKGTALSGFYDIKPVVVTVEQKLVSNPGPDQILEYKFSTTLDAILDVNESGMWRADSGNVSFSDVNDPHTDVSDLSEGRNVLEWIVSTAICPSDTGKITVTVRGLVVPTLITPNGDSWNEYFVLNGLETLGKTDLIIFDRRGRELFRNTDYDNKWNGVDYNGNPLPDDTYFFVLKSANGKSLSGYIMIRR
jgi:gliding motility-associated-like protein